MTFKGFELYVIGVVDGMRNDPMPFVIAMEQLNKLAVELGNGLFLQITRISGQFGFPNVLTRFGPIVRNSFNATPVQY